MKLCSSFTYLGKELKSYDGSSYYNVSLLDENFIPFTFSCPIDFSDKLSLLVPKEDYEFEITIRKGLIQGRECLKGYISSIPCLD